MLTEKMQRTVGDWATKNFGAGRPSYWPLLGVVEEVGELCHAHLKGEQGVRTNEDHLANAKDAVGDILIYMMDYCECMGFDMEEIFNETWAEVSKRDWKKNPETGI